MSNRLLRVNELLQREISAHLRRKHASESVAITITGVDVPAKEVESGKTKLDKAEHYMKVSAIKMVAVACP